MMQNVKRNKIKPGVPILIQVVGRVCKWFSLITEMKALFFPSLAMPVLYIHTYVLLASCFLPLASCFLLLCEARRRPGAECRRLHFLEVESNKSLGPFVCVCVWSTGIISRYGKAYPIGKLTTSGIYNSCIKLTTFIQLIIITSKQNH